MLGADRDRAEREMLDALFFETILANVRILFLYLWIILMINVTSSYFSIMTESTTVFALDEKVISHAADNLELCLTCLSSRCLCF